MSIKIDDDIASLIVNNISIFKYIHPNILTLIGILCNLVLITKIECNMYILVIIVIRFLADILDGAVAVKYNKTSKFGCMLDSLSDFMFAYIFIYSITKQYTNLSYEYPLIVILILAIYNQYKYNIFNTHAKLKTQSSDNVMVSKIEEFISNNTFVPFIIYAIILCG
jgi:phosphatidylglycerophosphate synthase